MIARTEHLKTRLKNTCRRFMTDRAGNIAMTFAIVSVPLLGGIGAAIDYTRALNLHREIQASLDAALVAAVNDIGTKDETALKQQLANWIAAEASTTGSYTLDTSTVVIDKNNYAITAKVTASVSTSFLQVVGKKTIPIAVQATVVSGAGETKKNAFSMYFVLDRSGSMDEPTNTSYQATCTNFWGQQYTCTKLYTKMESLKMASADLLGQFNIADPKQEYVRTGSVSYNNEMQTAQKLGWGTSKVATYIENLYSTGSTNSGEAFETAYNALTVTGTKSEEAKHEAKNGVTKPDKYIVFMTDGANNVAGADTKTKQYCDKARTAGIKVYTIAFMAPTEGKKLLSYCATTSAEYFAAEDTAGLVAAFKLIGETASKTLVRLTN